MLVPKTNKSKTPKTQHKQMNIVIFLFWKHPFAFCVCVWFIMFLFWNSFCHVATKTKQQKKQNKKRIKYSHCVYIYIIFLFCIFLVVFWLFVISSFWLKHLFGCLDLFCVRRFANFFYIHQTKRWQTKKMISHVWYQWDI